MPANVLGTLINLFLDRLACTHIENEDVLLRISWNYFARRVIEEIVTADQNQQSVLIRTKYAAERSGGDEVREIG